MLNGVDELGKESEIKVGTSKTLPKNTYLKVSVKGKYVKTYGKVQGTEVPEKAKKRL
ncbi:YxeA family protein [Brevibacillus laterosporus]|uniref:YxeA family protein n=1 Tax=Brevibacillus laterosporus TaxID=1465 RepID=UPI00265CD22E|nr:YxeA family protein [Brevibacillus laterosporus]